MAKSVVEMKEGDPAAGSKGASAKGGNAGMNPGLSKERVQALDRTLGQIEKTFGKGSIMRLDNDSTPVIPGISTGAISLDLGLG
ncbi:MAG: DNA recombination/repair protein RecA, partial [Phycisphaerales bacterium]|nr:DNA recombination/repair protein RecA [Phycisphaerales bacterium]